MNITRRRFLQGLFAVPVLAAPLLVPERLYPEVWVGGGASGPASAMTLGEALGKVESGGVIWLMPGHSETWSTPLDVKSGTVIKGMGAGSYRPRLSWRLP